MRFLVRVVAGLLVFVLLGGLTVPAQAVGKDFLVSKKFHGALVLGLGGLLLKESLDAKSEANDAYDFYIAAGQALTARQFYDDSKRHDTRAAVYGVLGVGAIVYSVHLFMKDDDNLPTPKMEEGIINVKGVSLGLDGNLMQKKLGLHLRKGF
jgi:hypothetical protein